MRLFWRYSALRLSSLLDFFQQLDLVTPFHLYFNWHLILHEYQVGTYSPKNFWFGNLKFGLVLFVEGTSETKEGASYLYRTKNFRCGG